MSKKPDFYVNPNSKFTPEKQKEIDAKARRVARAYNKYKELSVELSEFIQPEVDLAWKLKNEEGLKILSELQDLTCPCDRNGQPLRGEYLGRFDLFLAAQHIKEDMKGKKKKGSK